MLNVLFVHPSYPNTFLKVVDALAQRPGIRCAYLVENRCQDTVRHYAPQVPFFGFDPEPTETNGITSEYLASYEHWIARGKGVSRSLKEIYPYFPYDVIVGSASTGCMIYAREMTDCGIVSYCEHPSYALKRSRKEFPVTFDQHMMDISYQSIVLTSVAHSDLGLVASEHAKKLFPEEYHNKVRVQSEGFGVPTFMMDTPDLKKLTELPADAPIIGFFGRTLESVRGFDIFLRVAKRIREIRPEIQILVIGAEETSYGNEKMYLGSTSFKNYALAEVGMNSDEIIWRDFLPYDRFRAHVACMDVAILPTFEGASNWSFFDAMAAGTAILSTNQSYIPELMQDGKEGYLFDPYDIEAFALKAVHLLDRPEERNRIGQAARHRILHHHTPERAAEGYEKVIREAFERAEKRTAVPA